MELLKAKQWYDIDKKKAIEGSNCPQHTKLVKRIISKCQGVVYCYALNYSIGLAEICESEYAYIIGTVSVPIESLKRIKASFAVVN